MKRILLVLLSGVLLVMQPGCRGSVPIKDIENQTLTRENGRALTTSQVRQAIIAAARSDRKQIWDLREEREGYFVGKLVVRGRHTIVVDIFYNATRLDIKYRDSINMKFEKEDEGRSEIHPNYNVWVDDLLQAILFEIQKLDSISTIQRPSQNGGNIRA